MVIFFILSPATNRNVGLIGGELNLVAKILINGSNLLPTQGHYSYRIIGWIRFHSAVE